MLPSLASRVGLMVRRVGSNPTRSLVTRGGVAISDRADSPRFIDSAVNTVAGEVGFDQLEPHELSRLRIDREKQLDVRNFTLNFGPQHPVCFPHHVCENPYVLSFLLLTDSIFRMCIFHCRSRFLSGLFIQTIGYVYVLRTFLLPVVSV